MRLIGILITFCITSLNALTPMSYEDIVTISKPIIVQMAPNGNVIAYVTRKGDIKNNKNVDSLLLVEADGAKSNSIHISNEIVQVVWSENSSQIYTLNREKNRYSIQSHLPVTQTLVVEEKRAYQIIFCLF